MPAGQPQQVSTIVWLIQSGGFVPLAIGLSLAVIGAYYIIRPSRRGALIVTFLSFVPGLLGLIAIYNAATDYGELAGSPIPPKPAELAALTGRAMGSGFGGVVGTIVPLFVAVLAQIRALSFGRMTHGTTDGRSETA